jgi:radical SAM protein (TIGR01212 family)
MRERFGERLQKVSVNAGLTCPNRDGTAGYGGCSYCIGNSFIPSYCQGSLKDQINKGIAFQRFRYRRVSKYIAYLQAYTNTYSPAGDLKELYEEVLSHPGICGLCIATRPDCVDENALDLICGIACRYPVWIELGVESCNDKTLELVNRGHTFAQSVSAIRQIAKRNLPVSAHLVFGLPGDTRENMLVSAEVISSLPVHSVKLHQLQIYKKARIYDLYLKSPELFHVFSLADYCEFAADFIERLDPRIAVERMAAEAPPEFEAVNHWGQIRVEQVAKKIESVMEIRETWQGIKLKNLL